MVRCPAAWVRGGRVPPCVRAPSWRSIILVAWREGTRVPAALTAPLPQGVDVHLGWLLTPRDWREHAERVLEDARTLGARSIVLDPEADWLDADDDDARELVTWFRARRMPVVVCSYGIPPGRFPLEGFAEASQGIAQTYDRELDAPPDYLERSAERWRRAGFRDVLPSVGLIYNPPGTDASAIRTKTRSELAAHLEHRDPARSVVWGPVTWPRHACELLAAWASSSRGRPGVGPLLLLLASALLAARAASA